MTYFKALSGDCKVFFRQKGSKNEFGAGFANFSIDFFKLGKQTTKLHNELQSIHHQSARSHSEGF
jgi:hypothetical protein